MRTGGWVCSVALSVFLLGACTSPASPGSEALPTVTSTDEPTAGGLHGILATTVLRTGPQRVAFVLTSPESLVTAPEATVTSVYLDSAGGGGDGEARETKQARFFLWPYGVRGSYSTELTFPEAGAWRLDVSVTDDATKRETRIPLEVSGTVGVAEPGMMAPLGRNKTVRDVESLAQLSSAGTPDPDLYALSISEAIATGKPTMVVFSTPAFCVSPTCGPQVEVLSELKEQYRDEANFIHVELYDNPDEVQGDLTLARYSPLVAEWGLATVPEWTNESWTFLLGLDGTIAFRFEAFVPKEELEQVLLATL